jgi:hypothetical protein
VQVKIIAPDLSQQTLALQLTAPGRWEGNFPAIQVGASLLRATWQAGSSNREGSNERLTATTGLVGPYSPEYSHSGPDLRFLGLLARAGGGTVLCPGDSALAFSQNLPPANAALPITFWLFALVALLLPVDIALRRFASPEFVVFGYRWLASRLGLPRAAQAREGTDNQRPSTIRAQRQAPDRRQTNLEPRDLPHKVLNSSSSASQRQSGKEEITALKKQREVLMTEKLLEAKRKRASEKRRREW